MTSIDYKPTASLAGFRFEDGFLMTRPEYDAALDALYVGTAVLWSELRAYVECQRDEDARIEAEYAAKLHADELAHDAYLDSLDQLPCGTM